MAEFSFETIKKFHLKSIAKGVEAELSLYMNGEKYMIIIYANRRSFFAVRRRRRHEGICL